MEGQAEQLAREVKEATEAKYLTESPAFKRAFELLEGGVIDHLRKVGVNDDDRRNQLVLTLQLLDALRAELSRTIETGKLAQVQIEQPSLVKRLFG